MNEFTKPEMQLQVTKQQTAIEQVVRGETEIQATLAKRFPRDIKRSVQSAEAMATITDEVAAACFYAIPRGGRTIEGPSVRLAEILASCWGNIRVLTRIIDTGDTHVVAQGVCWDLETNYWATTESRRRITDRNGRRYNDDMIAVTSNAAASIAYREAVFKVIGRGVIDPIWQKCREVAVGKAKSIGESWKTALAHFAKMGIDEVRVRGTLGKKNGAQITQDDLVTLRGLSTALKDGDTTVEAAFPEVKNPDEDSTNSFGFKKKQEKQEAQEPEDEDRREELLRMRKGELLDMAEEMHCHDGGPATKERLIEAILEAETHADKTAAEAAYDQAKAAHEDPAPLFGFSE